MSGFAELTKSGDVRGAFRVAAVTACLWSIGTSWSNAISSFSHWLLPDSGLEEVWAGLLAAVLTTAIAIGISLGVSYDTRSLCSSPPPPPPSAATSARRPR